MNLNISLQHPVELGRCCEMVNPANRLGNAIREFNQVAGHIMDFHGASFETMFGALEKQRWIVGLEHRELIDLGIKAKNPVEILDGVVDIIYTGLWLERQYQFVLHAVKSQLDYFLATSITQEVYPEPIALNKWLDSKGQNRLNLQLLQVKTLLWTCKSLIMYYTQAIGYRILTKAVDRVIEANKAKYFDSPAELTNAGGDPEWTVKETSMGDGQFKYCWVDAKGKMKKPHSWKEPVLDDLIPEKLTGWFLEDYHA